jgi:8-amino-7-oxononanoate synthase
LSLLSELDNFLSKELEDLRSKLRFRDPSILQELQTSVENSTSSLSKISFCSNDYLGLSKHPSLRSVLIDSLEPTQFGAGASRLVMGSFQDHLDLEQSISRLVGLPSTLTFSSGYSANVGTIPSLIGPDDIAIVDRQVHASIVDGCRLSRAKLAVFKHLSVSDAERVLSRFSSRACKKLLITESLFSMSGAYSPLGDLSELCRRYGAFLYVDEAHAIGTIGNQGSGICKLNNVIPHVLVGTLGKSLGTFGAFVSGSKVLRDFLFNRARSFIYSTAVPPCMAFAAKTGVELAASSVGDSLRCSLESRVALFRKLFSLPETSLPSPIIPWILGGEREALQASSLLREKGFLVQAIRPPTVKAGTSRLRISISSLHSEEEIERLAASIKSLPFSSAPSAFLE